MKNLIVLVLLISVFVFPKISFSENRYVRNVATGNGTGTDWTNAWTNLPENLIRGDTYYIADGNYGSYTFDDTEIGTQYITIKKATTFNHGTNTGWDDAYGDGVAIFAKPSQSVISFLSSYWIFDGSVGSGTSGHGFKVILTQIIPNGGVVALASGVSNITISHVEIEGAGDGSGDDGIGSGGSGSDNVVISYCYIHDVGRTIFLTKNCNNWLIEYNHLARNESTPDQHSEGISASTCSNFTFRYNLWEDIEGTGVIVFDGSNLEVYGDVFYHTLNGVAGGLGNGVICTWSAATAINVRIYNNTFIYLPTGRFASFSATSSNITAYNNISFSTGTYNVWVRTTHDYNLYVNDENANEEDHGQYWAGGNELFVDYDNYNFRLTQETYQGRSDFGSPYNQDMDGSTRGADGNWDRGAYEYSSIIDVLEPPSSLRVTQ